MSWWITTDILARGGTKIMGPFVTQEKALDTRTKLEKLDDPVTYWVDEEADTQGTDLQSLDSEANSRQAEAPSGAGEKGRL